jgi:TetR/AcrR family transcriptional regulator, fatty acid metabolism regulator protein
MVKNKFSKRKLQGIETKKRLMNCAISLFREKGYHNVTVDEIIEKAESSKGGFYTHFNSKEELLYNLVGMLDEAYMEFVDQEFTDKSSSEKILSFIQFVFKIIEEQIGLEFIAVIYASQIKDMTSQRFAVTPQRKFYQILEKFINEGKEKSEITNSLPVEYAVRVITTGIRGVVYDWCLSNGEFDLVEYGSEIITILLKQLIPASKT